MACWGAQVPHTPGRQHSLSIFQKNFCAKGFFSSKLARGWGSQHPHKTFPLPRLQRLSLSSLPFFCSVFALGCVGGSGWPPQHHSQEIPMFYDSFTPTARTLLVAKQSTSWMGASDVIWPKWSVVSCQATDWELKASRAKRAQFFLSYVAFYRIHIIRWGRERASKLFSGPRAPVSGVPYGPCARWPAPVTRPRGTPVPFSTSPSGRQTT